LSYNKATGILLSGGMHKSVVHTGFCVSADPDLDSHSKIKSLISQIAKKISEMGLKFDDTTLALDSAMFARHDLHSEFTDHKQIASTIAFDAEEAVATDAMELAVTFTVTGTNNIGSDVTVFTAKRDALKYILDELKSINLDPVTVEPDTVCLWRYLDDKLANYMTAETLTVVLADGICYLICPWLDGFAANVRSILIYPNQKIAPLLARQVPITIAAHAQQSQEKITNICLAGNLEDLDIEKLADMTGLSVQTVDLIGNDDSQIDHTISPASIAIAAGCGMAEHVKEHVADFRNSFMPFQGKKILLQKSIRTLTIYLTVLMIAVGVYFQAKVFSKNNAIETLNEKALEVYSDVMFGKKPNRHQAIITQLKNEANRVKKAGGGLSIGDEKSVSAQLTYLLQAINSLPSSVKLTVKDITISARGITIVGNTNSRSSSLKLSKAISDHKKLQKGKEDFKNAPGSGNAFTISATLK
jgi:hypothetical protein